MSISLDAACLHSRGSFTDTSIYELRSGQFNNRYFILTSPLSRHLLASPEVVGYDSYLALVRPTVAAIRFLRDHGLGDELDIMTILRGGLNYPLEEACHNAGIRVRNMHFLSCERIIKDNVIQGLDIKYEKIGIAKDIVLTIGDIFATGDTFRLCMEHVVRKFASCGGSIRRLLFFTVGGTRAITQMEDLCTKMKELFPGFEGIDCFFFEGIFSVYTDKGTTGINVPDIDFGWKGGVVCPDFRRYILESPEALYEKCIIYDGGARRYEIPLHFSEVLEYWNGILERSENIPVTEFTEEKLGYSGRVSFEQWLSLTHFSLLAEQSAETRQSLEELWKSEDELLACPQKISLSELSRKRITDISKLKALYE